MNKRQYNQQLFNITNLSARIAKNGPDLSAATIAYNLTELIRLDGSLNRLNELARNADLSARQSKRREKMEAQAVALGQELGITVETQRDPRGTALRAIFPSEPNYFYYL